MGIFDGRVVIVTGAGRGLGRAHALLFAQEGARVVVNDLGGGGDGSGHDAGVAGTVVEEIRALGGEALANGDDISDFDGARRLVQSAVDAYGRLDVLVNNAGILRDRFLVNMSEEEWDSVVQVHLRGHFCTLRHAAAYWKDEAKAGRQVEAAVVNTASGSGLFPNPGQANYGAAKAGIAAMTLVAAAELGRYGVRVNAIAPAARTRLTLATPGMGDLLKAPDDPGAFDPFDPAHVSPLVAYLCAPGTRLTGQVFFVQGKVVRALRGWEVHASLESKGDGWTIAELDERLGELDLPPVVPGEALFDLSG